MKYIDAEKLKSLLTERYNANKIGKHSPFRSGKVETLRETIELIGSLQQEQPGLPGIDESGVPGKDYIPVDWVDACENYGKWKIVKQEQPEVDLEKEIEEHAMYMPHGEFSSDNELLEDMEWARKEFRHFYELGLNARKEKLPEIELDKFINKVDTFKARYKHPESIAINGAMAFMARMFYQYPNVARRWYDSLPKAIMD